MALGKPSSPVHFVDIRQMASLVLRGLFLAQWSRLWHTV